MNFYETTFHIKIHDKFNNPQEALAYLVERGDAPILRNYRIQEINQILKVVHAHLNALEQFNLPIIEAPILLLKCDNNRYSSSDLGWNQYTTQSVSVCDMYNTNHWTILEKENSKKIAKIICNTLKTLNNPHIQQSTL